MNDKKEKRKGLGSIFKKGKPSETTEIPDNQPEPDYSGLISSNNDEPENSEKSEGQNNDDLSMLLLKLRTEKTEQKVLSNTDDESLTPIIDAEIKDESIEAEEVIEEEKSDNSDLINVEEIKETEISKDILFKQDSGSSELKEIFERMKSSEKKEEIPEPKYDTEYKFTDITTNNGQIDEIPVIQDEYTEENIIKEPEISEEQEIKERQSEDIVNTESQSNKPKSLQEIIESVTKKAETKPVIDKTEIFHDKRESEIRAETMLGELKKEDVKEFLIKGKPKSPVFKSSPESDDEYVEIIAEAAKYDEEDRQYENANKDISANVPTKKTPLAQKTQWSEKEEEKEEEENAGVVLIDQISPDFSGLILPEGATFEIEEFRIHSKKKAIETGDRESVLSRIDQILDQNLPSFDVSGITEKELKKEHKKEKSGLFGKFKSETRKTEEYDPTIHGPLVDLAFRPEEAIEELELYPVNEPFAYVRIVYDKNSNEYLYYILEPQLNDAEKELFAEIEQRLFETLDVNTKSISKDEARDIHRKKRKDHIQYK